MIFDIEYDTPKYDMRYNWEILWLESLVFSYLLPVSTQNSVTRSYYETERNGEMETK